jgi:hypothetical protein
MGPDGRYERVDSRTCERIIEAVKQRPYLYNNFHEKGRDKTCKALAWIEVATEENLPVEEVKRIWIHLRERYCREKHQTKNSCSSKGGIWSHYHSMEFLSPFVRNRRYEAPEMKLENDESHSSIYPEDPMLVFNSSPNNDALTNSDEINLSLPGVSNRVDENNSYPDSPKAAPIPRIHILTKRRCLDNRSAGYHSVETHSFRHSLTNGFTSESTEVDDEMDSHFIKLIENTLRRLEPASRSLAKIKIQILLHELEFPNTPL